MLALVLGKLEIPILRPEEAQDGASTPSLCLLPPLGDSNRPEIAS